MTAIIWHDWLFKWVWSADSMGNPVDDVILAVGAYFVVRAIKAGIEKIHNTIKAHHAIMLAHNAKIIESQQKLHDHLGTGHTVDPSQD